MWTDFRPTANSFTRAVWCLCGRSAPIRAVFGTIWNDGAVVVVALVAVGQWAAAAADARSDTHCCSHPVFVPCLYLCRRRPLAPSRCLP